MIRRNTWVLLVVFIILLAAAVYLQRSGRLNPAEAAVTPTRAEQLLLDIQAGTIRSLRIQDGSGKTVALERVDQGTWKLVEPQQQPADTSKIDPAITSLTGLSVLNPLDATLSLDVAGLEAPAYTITVGLGEGGQRVIQVGKATPTGTGYYTRLDGGTPVVVSKFGLDSIVGLLENPPALATSTAASGTETTGAPASESGTPEPQGTSQPIFTETATATP